MFPIIPTFGLAGSFRGTSRNPALNLWVCNSPPHLCCLPPCPACSLGADEALERVQRAFDTRKDNERRSPETDEQHAMVRKFVAAHKERKAGTVHRAD